MSDTSTLPSGGVVGIAFCSRFISTAAACRGWPAPARGPGQPRADRDPRGLGGIAFVIVRDARAIAPVVESATSGGSRNPQARLRKRRAKAKIARQHRKNRR